MGNAQSTESESPCPLCRALCLRSGQSASKLDDEGEWFGDLPRDKSSKRRGKGRRKSKSKSQKKLGLGKQPSMPPVPEVSACW